MKKRRGRPRGKVFPQQDNLLKGRLVATYGKIGESEEMVIATCCPHSYIHDDEKNKELRQLRETWNCDIGSIIGQKIISRDHEFFRRMADSVEALAKFNGSASPTRSHAVWYKIICHLQHEPFTLMGLRNYYEERGRKVDSSTLSKIYRWAKSAEVAKVHMIPPALMKAKKSGAK